MEISYNQIKKITQDGIELNTDNNKTIFIDFEVCRQNWVIYVNDSNDFKKNNLKIEETRCVGARDITDKPKYFILYSDSNEPMKIIFNQSPSFFDNILRRDSKLNEANFLKLQNEIYDNNWTTFDLS